MQQHARSGYFCLIFDANAKFDLLLRVYESTDEFTKLLLWSDVKAASSAHQTTGS